MKQFINRMLNMHIRDRLVLYFLLAMLIPTMLITFLLYQHTTVSIERKMNEFANMNLQSVESLITQKLNLVNDLITLLNINATMQEIYQSPPPPTTERTINEMSTLENLLIGYFASNNYLHVGSGLTPRIYMYNRSRYAWVGSSSFLEQVCDISAIEQELWYQELSNRFTVVGLRHTDRPYVAPALVVARKLFNTKKDTNSVSVSAVLTVDISVDSFRPYMETYMQDTGGTMVVTDAQGIILMSTQPGDVGFPYAHFGAPNAGVLHPVHSQGEAFLLTERVMDTLEWRIYSQIPLSSISNEREELNRILIVLVMACMFFAVVIALLFSRQIALPIQRLAESMKKVSRDNTLTIDVQYGKNDEFGYLIDTYRSMMAQIHSLIHELYIKDLQKKEVELHMKDARLSALQAQINPHFLYNTLDSINLYALKYNIPQIGGMISALSDFFRYGLSQGRDMITVEEELMMMEGYLKIQKMRFGDCFDYCVDVPDDMMRCLIVKFTLQPLVENAIVHGIHRDIDRKGLITVRAYAKREDMLVFEVEDNGKGADIALMEEMLQSDSGHSKAFGIRNVNERLRMHFGAEYGLRYRPHPAEGTIAEVRFQKVLSMEALHVQNDHS